MLLCCVSSCDSCRRHSCWQILRRHAPAFTVRSGIFIAEMKTETHEVVTWCNRFPILDTFYFLYWIILIFISNFGPFPGLRSLEREMITIEVADWHEWGYSWDFPVPPKCRTCEISGKAFNVHTGGTRLQFRLATHFLEVFLCFPRSFTHTQIVNL